MTIRNFWRESQSIDNRVALVGNSVINRVWYLFPQGGGPRGSFTTFADLSPNLRDRDLILLSGVLREQVIAPLVYDVTILGAANEQRQATNSGVPTGGGASWLAPTSPTATTPLIRVIAQGWSFSNIQFAPVAASACITFDRRETVALPDSSHGSVDNCYFSTGGSAGHGVELIEVKKIVIDGCVFEALTGAGGHAIKSTAGASIANVNHCTIRNSKFVQNANDIFVVGDRCLVQNNVFYSTNPVTAGNRVNFLGGTDTSVLDNTFKDVAADVVIAKGYKSGTTGQWRNWVFDSNVPIVTVPT
jgi:hypothetical protein